jgi:hypothetical protein
VGCRINSSPLATWTNDERRECSAMRGSAWGGWIVLVVIVGATYLAGRWYLRSPAGRAKIEKEKAKGAAERASRVPITRASLKETAKRRLCAFCGARMARPRRLGYFHADPYRGYASTCRRCGRTQPWALAGPTPLKP